MPRMSRLVALACLSLPCLGSCGGGSSVISVILFADPTEDGSVTSDAQVLTNSLGIRAGDLDGGSTNGTRIRGFLTFNIAAIPAGSFVTSAVFFARQRQVVGNPYATHGTLFLGRVTYPPPLDPLDFDGAAAVGSLLTLSTEASISGRFVDVRAAVQSSVSSGSPIIQFRVRFSTESDFDFTDDYVVLEDAENSGGTGSPPLLFVRYIP